MELRQMRYVVAVAEELHFGRAAQRLLVAQPSLSRQVRELERDLGVELFRRTSRSVQLTAAGSAFVAEARRTMTAVDATRQAAVDAAAGEVGRATLGFVASAAVDILPPLVRRHRELRPRVRLTLREMTTEEQVIALHEELIDVGLSRDLEDQEGIAVKTLFREPLLAVIPTAHPMHHRRTIGVADLADSEFVTLPQERVPRAWDRLVLLAHASGVRLRFAQEANQFATLLALVAAEVGVAVVPASVRALRQDGVHYLRLRDEGAWTAICAAVREDNTNPTARDLQAELQAGFPRNPT